MINRVLVVTLLTLAASAFAADPAGRPPIREFVDPTEMRDPTGTFVTNLVTLWVTCTECGSLNAERVAGFGNKAVSGLEKAYDGDDEFLGIAARQEMLSRSYDRFEAYLTRPSGKSQFIRRETDKVKRLAKARAREALEAIGTPEALTVLALRGAGPTP